MNPDHDLFSWSRNDPGVSAPNTMRATVRIFANGYDVTDRMPLTRAVLEQIRAVENQPVVSSPDAVSSGSALTTQTG